MTVERATAAVKIHTRGLLFDMDGVLVSSLGSVERSWRRWAERHGMDVDSTVRAAHGRRAIDTLRALLPEGDHAAELKAIEDLEVADMADMEILDGVMPILTSLPQKYWTIVTSATGRLARARLAYGGVPVPQSIVTGEMVEVGKPGPEPYMKGAQILGLLPGDCLVIEDSVSGAQAGHNAGCKVLATTFLHSADELTAADWVVHSLAGVTVTVLGGDLGLMLELQSLRG